MTLVRVPINNYWCSTHWQPYAQLPDVAQKFASKEAQRLCAERKDFRDAVKAKRSEWGIRLNNACELVIIDWVREHKLAMCCILGDDTMERISKQARAYAA